MTPRARFLFAEHQREGWVRTDRLFAGLLLLEWAVGIVASLWLSPVTWAGAASRVHLHVWAAILLGGAITLPAVLLVWRRPGTAMTRHAVVSAQALWSALLIHLCGGRIETHFHIFGSLAIMAFYRDPKVLITAAGITALDHWARGIWWPESVYGIAAPEPWRWLEHTGWVVFEVVFLLILIRQSRAEMRAVARRTAELEASHAEVEEKVRRRTAELAEARDEAMASAKAKSEFLANMSHEIRTPLNGVMGFLDILSQTPLDETQRSHLTTMRGSGESLLTIINDILDFSKIEAGGLELESVAFDLRELVEDVGQLLAPKEDARRLELVCGVDGDASSAVVGDPTRIRQILVNLAGNAIKFTTEGEVEIRATLEATASGRTRATLIVRDTGIGIPPARLEHIFDSFTQVDGSTTRKFGGTGLGLTITRRLVELMHGTIEVTSTPGEGSTFTVVVELHSAPAIPAQLTAHADGLDGLRVLAVDDNATNRQVLANMLARVGAEVVSAESGPEALRWLGGKVDGSRHFDVAILDMQMPEMDGMELAAALAETHPALPRVLLTSVDVRRASLPEDATFDAILTKPVRSRLLLGVLARLLGRAPAPRRQESSPRATSPLPPMHVLLVEDNAVNRRLVLLLLERWGLTADVAENGLQAVERAAEKAYDLILMDATMPVMDGFEATRRIRATEGPNRSTAIIALTARAMEGDRELCLDAGMDAFVTKPIDQERLHDMLRLHAPEAAPPTGP